MKHQYCHWINVLFMYSYWSIRLHPVWFPMCSAANESGPGGAVVTCCPDQTAAIIIIIIINPPRTLINWSLYNHSRAQNKFSVSRLQWSVTAAAAPPPHSDKSVLTLAAHRDYSGYNHTLRCSYYGLHIHLQTLPTRTVHESKQSHQSVPCVGLSTWSYTNNRWSESFDPLFYPV